MLSFVNHARLTKDVLAWERALPPVDAFVGIPRSGLIPATMLALRRNVPLVPIDLLIDDPATCLDRSPLRHSNPSARNPKPRVGAVMVVDDSCSQFASTMRGLREILEGCPLKVHYGAVYRATETDQLDHWFRTIPQPRMFEWNFFRHHGMTTSMWDIDGALCEEWEFKEKYDREKYQQHLARAKPLYIPEHPVLSVCTNRLTRNRRPTIQWLEDNGVRYGDLLMQSGTLAERDARDKPRGTRKGKRFLANTDATLFVESDVRQAQVIAQIAKKPVLAIDEMRIFQ